MCMKAVSLFWRCNRGARWAGLWTRRGGGVGVGGWGGGDEREKVAFLREGGKEGGGAKRPPCHMLHNTQKIDLAHQQNAFGSARMVCKLCWWFEGASLLQNAPPVSCSYNGQYVALSISAPLVGA